MTTAESNRHFQRTTCIKRAKALPGSTGLLESWNADGPKNAALSAYVSNAACWSNNGYASSHVLPSFLRQPPLTDYILITTNVSPFNSQQQWTHHTPANAGATLALWEPNQHLCGLIKYLGSQIDLWVVHGKGAVWPTFWPQLLGFHTGYLRPRWASKLRGA